MHDDHRRERPGAAGRQLQFAMNAIGVFRLALEYLIGAAVSCRGVEADAFSVGAGRAKDRGRDRNERDEIPESGYGVVRPVRSTIMP
jgi:hypothetical protein